VSPNSVVEEDKCTPGEPLNIIEQEQKEIATLIRALGE